MKPVLPPIVSADTVHDLLGGDRPPVVFDLREPYRYSQGHIPGALPLDPALFNRNTETARGLLPDADELNAQLRAHGVCADRPVIVYDEDGGPAAARAAWTLRAFGHEAAAMLDGGLIHYAARHRLARGKPPLNEDDGDFEGAWRRERIADRRHILARLGAPDLQLVDTRSAAEYGGRDRRAWRAGHIPGAVHLDWRLTKGADGRFLPEAALRALLAERGLDPNKETICYCQSHQRSSVVCLLLEALGFTRVKGYPGAWSDWGNQPDTPVAAED
ncbi:MAG: sulfurtransferase [Gammaproteobacteria bacterium]|nr:MAG: sulfurtransferase [Gammaproteobacteria bacterium]